jgi:hypothetical protein
MAPQFATAEYAGTDRCKFCNQIIPGGGSYYRVDGAMACKPCAEQARNSAPKDSHAAFARAVLFGVGAAIAGLVLYAGFEIMTGWIIGYVSLAVGYMVGKAMMAGSKGLGGRRYQLTAVALTYAAVSMAAVPVWISIASKEHRSQAPSQAQQTPTTENSSDSEQQPGGNTTSQQQAAPAPAPKMNPWKALGIMAALGIASPFLELQDPVHGVIGLVILLVGIKIAWRLTVGNPTADVSGPFENPPPAHT